jgi:hypothetical protein
MLVPDYWAEARADGQLDGKPIAVRRFGWSTTSQLEAQTSADRRAREALARILSGEFLPRRELKRAYNGSEGVPIREEVVERRGDSVITRNSYGALCLNTPDCLFADIDFAEGPGWRTALIASAVLLLVAGAVGVFVHPGVGFIAAFAALVLCYPLALMVHRLTSAWAGGPETISRRRIEKFLERQPHWNLRLYRTPNGLRVLAIHATFDPSDPAVPEFFEAIGADPIYTRMCLRQHCFRARVSPKPWRIGISDHIRPRTVWPVDPEKLPQRREWVEKYERAAQEYASCRFLESLGSGKTHPKATEVQRLHDDLCRANVALPLA